MTGSGISTFSDPDDFATALGGAGTADLLVSAYTRFRARMTRIVLPHLRLVSAEEFQARVAFVSPAPGTLRVLFPLGNTSSLVCGGVRVEVGEIVTHRSGLGIHERLPGPCRWGDISLPVSYLDRYGRALSGRRFFVPPGLRHWRPPPDVLQQLTELHGAAMRVTEAHPGLAAGHEAAHGLEQQLMDGLIEILSGTSLLPETRSTRRHRQLMAQLEAARRHRPGEILSIREISAALRVSDRTLRQCCREHLDMAPDRYLRARRMQLVQRALRRADPSATTVSQIARRYGFAELGRFAASYRALFGELPSATLKG